MHKATILPDASEYPQEKKPSQKASAAQTKHEKELKEERMQKSIKSLATYEKKIKTMGFESTPIPPLPPGTTSRAKLPVVALTKDNVMNLDDEYGVEDFVAKIAAIGKDPDTDVMTDLSFVDFTDWCVPLGVRRRRRRMGWERRARRMIVVHCTGWKH